MKVLGNLEGLNPDLVSALNSLAVKFGKPVNAYSTKRTYEEQADLYKQYLAGTGNLAAKPGTSEHEFGNAVDADVDDYTDEQLASAGLFRTAPGESWHVSHIPRNKGGASMQPINLKNQFTGENYSVPVNPEYPTVVPDGFYDRLAEKPIVNSKAMAQRAMVDMLPILSKMYGGATYADSANTVAKVVSDMISGGAAAKGAEGDIANQMTQRGSMAEILNLIAKSKNPSEMAALVSAGKPFGGAEISPAIIGQSTVTPSNLLNAGMDAAKSNIHQSSIQAQLENAMKIAQQADARHRETIAAGQQAGQADAQQKLLERKEKAMKDFGKLDMDLRQFTDPNERASVYSANLPVILENLKYNPQLASKQIYNQYVGLFGSNKGLNDILKPYGIEYDNNGNIKDSSKQENHSKPQTKPTTTPTKNVSRPSNDQLWNIITGM